MKNGYEHMLNMQPMNWLKGFGTENYDNGLKELHTCFVRKDLLIEIYVEESFFSAEEEPKYKIIFTQTVR